MGDCRKCGNLKLAKLVRKHGLQKTLLQQDQNSGKQGGCMMADGVNDNKLAMKCKNRKQDKVKIKGKVNSKSLRKTVEKFVSEASIVDLHTHIYPPSFGPLNLWGIDSLLTYHYLIAEVFRWAPEVSPKQFYSWTVEQQADLIWQKLFVEHSPISEACRGVLTCLHNLGIETKKRDLKSIRKEFAAMTTKKKGSAEGYAERVFKIAGVREAVMTNDPFEPVERDFWLKGTKFPSRYKAVLRIDPLLEDWPAARVGMIEQGYKPDTDLTKRSIDEVKRFLNDWADRMQPMYCAVSLQPNFMYPEKNNRTTMIEECIIPFTRERNIPFATMIGVRRQINPALKLAGDGVGQADMTAVQNLCAAFPENRFMVTMLSRENQHELCIQARKFGNLLPFGCWWFMNVPSIIEEITRERLELIGLSVSPQHSDARVLDQLMYKWPHFRRILANVLTGQYQKIMDAGWTVTKADIHRDINDLLGDNFLRFAKG